MLSAVDVQIRRPSGRKTSRSLISPIVAPNTPGQPLDLSSLIGRQAAFLIRRSAVRGMK